MKSKTEVKHKAINMAPQQPLRQQECENWDFFKTLPDMDRKVLNLSQVKDSQLLRPLFEFSGACAGCGETPYLKLMTAAVRRPRHLRQRHRLLVDLRRQPAHHALLRQQGRPRPDVVELAV